MSRQAANRRWGAETETKIEQWLRDKGLTADRLRLTGREDQGDIAATDLDLIYVIEAKGRDKIDLSGFTREAAVEAATYARKRNIPEGDVMPLVVIRRRGCGVDDWYVVTTMSEFFRED